MELRIVRLTDRFDDACAFFGSLLGWPITREWPAGDGQGRGRIFGYGVARVELIEHPEPEPVSGVFLSVEHPAVDDLHEVLVHRGITVVEAPNDKPWGHRSFRVTEPTGLDIVFFQPSH